MKNHQCFWGQSKLWIEPSGISSSTECPHIGMNNSTEHMKESENDKNYVIIGDLVEIINLLFPAETKKNRSLE